MGAKVVSPPKGRIEIKDMWKHCAGENISNYKKETNKMAEEVI
jgi:hypothetical protein